MNSNEHPTGNAVLSLALGLCCLGLSGCSSTTVIKTAEQPPLQTGSALKSIKPLKVCLKDFQDLRGTEADLIFDAGGKRYRLDRPVATWVRDSIRREFERNGHAGVGPEAEREADLVIEGAVYRYSLDMHAGLEHIRVTGNVGAKISARAAKHTDAVFSKKYDGSFYSGGWNISIGTVIKIQNEALLNMIKELTTDPEFMDFLRRTAEVGAR